MSELNVTLEWFCWKIWCIFFDHEHNLSPEALRTFQSQCKHAAQKFSLNFQLLWSEFWSLLEDLLFVDFVQLIPIIQLQWSCSRTLSLHLDDFLGIVSAKSSLFLLLYVLQGLMDALWSINYVAPLKLPSASKVSKRLYSLFTLYPVSNDAILRMRQDAILEGGRN